tara:strand:+ start:321 stop:617 length:297 start_codon:yes stop_codon:yes gene_type:complete
MKYYGRLKKIKYNLDQAQINDRIKFKDSEIIEFWMTDIQDIDLLDLTGKVVSCENDTLLYVKLDKVIDDLKEWDNELEIDLRYYGKTKVVSLARNYIR